MKQKRCKKCGGYIPDKDGKSIHSPSCRCEKELKEVIADAEKQAEHIIKTTAHVRRKAADFYATRQTHDLKCWPDSFEAICPGEKRFEVREDDRGFDTGDMLLLREFKPEPNDSLPMTHAGKHPTGTYTGRQVKLRVGFVLRGDGNNGVVPGYCVMSIEPQ